MRAPSRRYGSTSENTLSFVLVWENGRMSVSAALVVMRHEYRRSTKIGNWPSGSLLSSRAQRGIAVFPTEGRVPLPGGRRFLAALGMTNRSTGTAEIPRWGRRPLRLWGPARTVD